MAAAPNRDGHLSRWRIAQLHKEKGGAWPAPPIRFHTSVPLSLWRAERHIRNARSVTRYCASSGSAVRNAMGDTRRFRPAIEEPVVVVTVLFSPATTSVVADGPWNCKASNTEYVDPTTCTLKEPVGNFGTTLVSTAA
jgi:hypothetical protein